MYINQIFFFGVPLAEPALTPMTINETQSKLLLSTNVPLNNCDKMEQSL